MELTIKRNARSAHEDAESVGLPSERVTIDVRIWVPETSLDVLDDVDPAGRKDREEHLERVELVRGYMTAIIDYDGPWTMRCSRAQCA